MPPNSEIEKLERRWKENPKGTVFAPYAEVLRKHGDHPMAKDVLRQGLELHPDHIPGNIVLGRCCLDLGEEGPAEAAFNHVLDLDSENVIALKALADITERQGRLMESAGWLNRLMTVDPSNDEAREQHARVALAREAASAAMSSPAPAPVPAESATTEVVAVVQPPTPPALEKPGSEPAAVEEEVVDLDAAVDSILGGIEEPAPTPTRVVPAIDLAAAAPVNLDIERAPMLDLVPGELDLPAATRSLEVSPLADLVPEGPAEPPKPKSDTGTDAFANWMEEAGSIELKPSGASEFQSPDDSAQLLELGGGRAEFQEPAMSDLAFSGAGGAEYQTASGAEELLESIKDSAKAEPSKPEPAPPTPDLPPIAPVMTSGFAAISLMPTEELSTRPEPAAEADTAPDPVEALSVIDTLAAAAEGAGAPPVPESVTGAVGAEGEMAAGVPTTDLRLIFPDEADQPEPQRIRRVSEEAGVLRGRDVAEPVPVVTETMAELYARQGHLAEALNVYRVLALRLPNDARLTRRIRELETAQAAGSRRMSYVAVDTGGESVESFFRTLAGARPTVEGSEGDDAGRAAPTRPTTDPLSLSAIFGEEAAPAVASPGDPPPPSGPGSFSFDQFFGGNSPSPSGTGPRQAMPSDEDLDQFQNWLKSLKR